MYRHREGTELDELPPASGAWLVETAILALGILLIGHRFGFAISLPGFAVAAVLAAALHFAGRKVVAFFRRKS